MVPFFVFIGLLIVFLLKLVLAFLIKEISCRYRRPNLTIVCIDFGRDLVFLPVVAKRFLNKKKTKSKKSNKKIKEKETKTLGLS